MDNLVQLMAAMAAAGYSQDDAGTLCEAVGRGALRAVFCQFTDTGEPFWLIETPDAWPPQNCFLAEWPRLRFGVHPNPNFCGACGHDSSQPDAVCDCACHAIYAGILAPLLLQEGQ